MAAHRPWAAFPLPCLSTATSRHQLEHDDSPSLKTWSCKQISWEMLLLKSGRSSLSGPWSTRIKPVAARKASDAASDVLLPASNGVGKVIVFIPVIWKKGLRQHCPSRFTLLLEAKKLLGVKTLQYINIVYILSDPRDSDFYIYDKLFEVRCCFAFSKSPTAAWLPITKAITPCFVFSEQHRLKDGEIPSGIYGLRSFSTLNTWLQSKFIIFILLPPQKKKGFYRFFSSNYYFSFLDVDLNF